MNLRGSDVFSRHVSRRGIVLIIVLVVIVILALAAYTFSQLMLAHRESTQLTGRQAQAHFVVASAVDSVRLFLAADKVTQQEMGGHFNNPAYFQGVIVSDAPDLMDKATFTLVAPSLDSEGHLYGLRYGLEDESARLNLNTLLIVDKLEQNGGRTMLMGLPGMTEDVADAILDWMDEDEEPRDFGAEGLDYQMMDPPYTPKNGPLESIEELLLVRGVTPQLLFGLDVNRNGLVDPHETMGLAAPTTGASTTTSSISSDTSMALDRGWSGYLTLYSKESNTDSLKQPKINLNEQDLELLQTSLSEIFEENWVKFIIAYRQYGPAQDEEGEGEGRGSDGGSGRGDSGGGGGSGGRPGGGGSGGGRPDGGGGGGGRDDGDEDDDRGGGGRGDDGGGGGDNDEEEVVYQSLEEFTLNLEQAAQSEIAQVLDLIGAEVHVQGQGGRTIALTSPFTEDPNMMREYLPLLMEYATVTAEPAIPGRININAAPRPVLLSIPGLDEITVDALIAQRDLEGASADPGRNYPTWLLAEQVLTLEQMKEVMPYVCGSGEVYRAQVIGYFQGGGAFSRAEVVWDATQPLPRVVFWRDISHLGRGYPLDVLGVGIMGGL